MKWIKKYNELNSWEVDRLKIELDDFCKSSIVYIVDEINDFKYRIDKNSTTYDISFFRSNPNHNRFSWDKVKDEFIPIIEMLSIKYDIDNIIFMTNRDQPIKRNNPEQIGIDHILTINDIIEDNIIDGVDDIMIIKIRIKIK